jgi:hypothetical protein
MQQVSCLQAVDIGKLVQVSQAWLLLQSACGKARSCFSIQLLRQKVSNPTVISEQVQRKAPESNRILALNGFLLVRPSRGSNLQFEPSASGRYSLQTLS